MERIQRTEEKMGTKRSVLTDEKGLPLAVVLFISPLFNSLVLLLSGASLFSFIYNFGIGSKNRMDTVQQAMDTLSEEIEKLQFKAAEAEEAAAEIMEQHQRLLNWADMFAPLLQRKRKWLPRM